MRPESPEAKEACHLPQKSVQRSIDRFEDSPIDPTVSATNPRVQFDHRIDLRKSQETMTEPSQRINCFDETDFLLKSKSLPVYYQYLLLHSLSYDDAALPLNPASWSRQQVHFWLEKLSQEHNVWPPVDSRCFPFNGKALCVLNQEMFVYRAPNCGKMLYKDLRLRLGRL